MFGGLIEAGEQLTDMKGLRAVVLSGEGRAFCAGLDMGRFEDMKTKGEAMVGLRDLTARTHGPANRPQWAAWLWRELPVPVIAAVHGVAFGGGFQIALGADMRYSTPDVKMSVMEIRWGLVPDVAGTQLMRHLCREDIVRELTYTGRIFSGEEAFAYGLVTRLTADPHAAALETAREIAGKNPHAIRAAKRLLNLAVATDAETGLTAESVEQLKLIGSPNQVEAVTAQIGKRAPNFAEV
jgi:enoyl-CoA hydratase/carnithine racemase